MDANSCETAGYHPCGEPGYRRIRLDELGFQIRINGKILGCARTSVIHQRGHITIGWTVCSQMPAGLNPAEELRGMAGQDAHRKTAEGNLQSHSGGFQISFLACPAMEESLYSCLGRQGPQIVHFPGEKKRSAIRSLAASGRMRSTSIPRLRSLATAYTAKSEECDRLKQSPLEAFSPEREGFPYSP